MPEAIQCGTCGKDIGTVRFPTSGEIREKLKGDYSPTAMMIKSALATFGEDVSGAAKFLVFRCAECAATHAPPTVN